VLGRPIGAKEIVHHRNGDKSDNDPANLEVLPSRAHHHVAHRIARRSHRLRLPGEDNPEVTCACGCETSFSRYDRAGRPRQFVSGHNSRRDGLGRYTPIERSP
jgi:hypothetical protein